MTVKKKTPLAPQVTVSGLKHKVKITWLILTWERLWPRLWPAILSGSLFIAAVLFGLFQYLSPFWHSFALAFGLAAVLASLFHAFYRFDWPNRRQALARLERDNNLSHQGLGVIFDTLPKAMRSKTSLAIWQAHRARTLQGISQVKLRGPKTSLGEKDPYMIRAALILLLLLGALEARFDWQDRVVQAFNPAFQKPAAKTFTTQIWITPPEYLNQGVSYFSFDQDQNTRDNALSAIQHAHVLVRLEGAPARESFKLNVSGFEKPFEAHGPGVYSAETRISQGGDLTIEREGQVVFSKRLKLIADLPPEISWHGETSQTRRADVILSFQATDDFALKSARLTFSRSEAPETELHFEKQLKGKNAVVRFQENLAAHPWAGQEVLARIQITDSADQSAFGLSKTIILPERIFSHVLANELINLRTLLYDRRIETIVGAQIRLDRILAEEPKTLDPLKVYLPIKVAADRLKPNANSQTIKEVQSILWETAVFLDEGHGANTRNQLDTMTRQIQQMMNEQTSAREMEALFEQMQQNLQRFLSQLQEAVPSDMNFAMQDLGENVQTIAGEELMQLLEQARALMRMGDKEGAQALMERFQHILSRMALQPQGDPEQIKKAADLLKELQTIRDDQKALFDKTFSRTRQSDGPSLDQTRQAIEEAREQTRLLDRLQREIEKLRNMSVQSPDSMFQSEQHMNRAARSLNQGLDESAIASQSQAIQSLSEGLEQAAKGLARQLGNQAINRQIPGYDPMGRRNGNRMDRHDGEMVPSEAEYGRSQEIMQELYRRASEKGRSEQELKYIERLLERF